MIWGATRPQERYHQYNIGPWRSPLSLPYHYDALAHVRNHDHALTMHVLRRDPALSFTYTGGLRCNLRLFRAGPYDAFGISVRVVIKSVSYEEHTPLRMTGAAWRRPRGPLIMIHDTRRLKSSKLPEIPRPKPMHWGHNTSQLHKPYQAKVSLRALILNGSNACGCTRHESWDVIASSRWYIYKWSRCELPPASHWSDLRADLISNEYKGNKQH